MVTIVISIFNAISVSHSGWISTRIGYFTYYDVNLVVVGEGGDGMDFTLIQPY